MGWFTKTFTSSIGKKFIMAITGILLVLFLIFHLAGNLSLYGGEKAFNSYAGALETLKPIVRVVEVILALIFIFHIIYGTKLWIENRIAKPVKYKINASSENSSLYSRFMFQTGIIVFIFLVLHLVTFWAPYNSGSADNLYVLVTGWFSEAWYSIFYIIAMVLLGFHLNHAFQSAFQTFGWNHNKYTPFIKKFGTFYAIVMAVGFASIPIYFLFFFGGK
jgi:succinate dehydrogenase cytochrome b subunit